MNRRALLVGALLVLPLIWVLGKGLGKDPRHIESPLIGQPAPAFELVDLEGNTVRLADLAGKPALINFWSTWCIPCAYEHPVIAAAARRYRDRVRFIGVIYQDEPATVRAYLARRKAWGPSLLDDTGRAAIAFGVYGVPETFILDRNGVITAKVDGALDPSTVDALLAEVL